MIRHDDENAPAHQRVLCVVCGLDYDDRDKPGAWYTVDIPRWICEDCDEAQEGGEA